MHPVSAAGLKGDLSKLSRLASAMRKLPVRLSQQVAAQVAPDLTGLTRAAFDGGRSVYGEARGPGVDGSTLTLRKTGALASKLQFTAIGTRVRAVLSVKYAKYHIHRGILPSRHRLPVAWQQAIRDAAEAQIRKGLPE